MKKIVQVAIAIMFVVNTAAIGQKMVINGKLVHSGNISKKTDDVSSVPYPEIHRKIKNYQVFHYDSRSFLNYVIPGSDVKKFQLNLGDHQWDFVIWKNDARASGYKLRAGDGKTPVVEVEPGPVTTYKGYVEGNEEMKVRINISEEHIQGVVMSDDVNYIIQTVSVFEKNNREVNQDDLVLYESGDMDFFGATCGAPIGAMEDIKLENLPGSGKESAVNEKASLAWECAEIAIACDYGFQQKAGGVSAGETRLLEIFNFVQGYYDKLELDYKIKEIYVSKNSSNNTWGNTNNSSTLLANFASWGPGGFSTSYDLASMYSTRDFNNSGVIGLAYLNVVCKSNRYNIMEYYPPWGNSYPSHAVDQAHEMGHNWGTNHEGNSSNIMYASLSGNNRTWSSAATTNINNYRRSVSCQDAGKCVTNEPPVAEFTADQTGGCGSLTVKFTDNSTFNPTAWSWDFGDGNTSSQQNPTHTYSSPGDYTVTLTVTNQFGEDEKIATDLITVGTGKPYPSANGGALDNTIGAGGLFATNDVRGLFFDAHTDIVIESFFAYAGAAGERKIEIISNASITGEAGEVTGNLYATTTVDIPSGDGRVNINISVKQGNNYFIKFSGLTDLYRNSDGASYPYKITDASGNDLLDITKSNVITDGGDLKYYYYFYDVKARKAGCTTFTSIDRKKPGIAFSTFPNPFNETLTLSLSAPGTGVVNVSLYDILGNEVQSFAWSLDSVQGNKKSINMTDLPKGTYILVATGFGQSYRKKIVK